MAARKLPISRSWPHGPIILIHYFDQRYKSSPYPLCLAHNLIGALGSDGNLYLCRTLRGEADYTYVYLQ